MPTNSVQQPLVACFQHYTPHPCEISDGFSNLFQFGTCQKHQMFLLANQHWDRFTVILDGLFRLYYLDQDGKEHTKGFFHEGQIMAPCAPSAIAEPATFFIECLEPAQILSGPYQPIRQHLESTLWGTHLLIGMLETIFEEKVGREYAFMNLDAEARYELFLTQNPTLSNRLPLYMVAGYLGMTDVTLSRIRKKRLHREDSNQIPSNVSNT